MADAHTAAAATGSAQDVSDPDAANYPAAVPSIVNWTPAIGTWQPAPGSRIVVSGSSSGTTRHLATQLSSDLQTWLGRSVAVVGGTPRPGDISLSLGANDSGLGEEGHLLDVGPTVTIRANARAGLL